MMCNRMRIYVVLTCSLLGLLKVSGLTMMTSGPFNGYLIELLQRNNFSHFKTMYMGCYARDGRTDKGLPHEGSLSNLTISVCLDYCRISGYTFAALTTGTRCLCGETIYGRTNNACNSNQINKCEGNEYEACGADTGAADVYRVCDYQRHGADTPPYECVNECPHCNNGCSLGGECLPGCGPGQKLITTSGGTSECSVGCDPGWYGVGCLRQNLLCNDGTNAHPLNGYCTDGCKNGKGIFCDLDATVSNSPFNPRGPCPICENCLNRNCYEHVDRNLYYQCPLNFGMNDVCNQCKDYYWGDLCNNKCVDIQCMECSKQTGTDCTRCTLNYWGSTCNLTCDSKCHVEGCDISTGKCLKCENGKYGMHCENECGHCFTGRCEQDSGWCIPCAHPSLTGTPYFTCNENCNEGYYGTQCRSVCSPHCIDSSCADESDYCNAGCVAGYYMPSCYAPCSYGCVSECDRYSGVCSACKEGRYGEICAENCPINCNNGACDRTTGNCMGGCAPGATGANCDTCEDGFWGALCADTCGQCAPGACLRENGTCTACRTGYYGSKCNMNCNMNCLISTCEQISGICTTGCVAGYFFPHCNKACPHVCVDTCNRSNGTCDSCHGRFYGEMCLEACPVNCKGTRCDRASGYCAEGCAEGFNGTRCDEPLPLNSDVELNADFKEMKAGSSATTGAIVGVVSCTLLLSLLTGAAYAYKHYKKATSTSAVNSTFTDNPLNES